MKQTISLLALALVAAFALVTVDAAEPTVDLSPVVDSASFTLPPLAVADNPLTELDNPGERPARNYYCAAPFVRLGMEEPPEECYCPLNPNDCDLTGSSCHWMCIVCW